jgi:four helix bundle protein
MMRLPYKELKIWQKGMSIAMSVYNITKEFPVQERYGLSSQMRRSAVSIPSNIAEGSQRTTNRDFYSFIAIARGSLAELETQILLSSQLQLLCQKDVYRLLQEIQELAKMLRAFSGKLLTTH